MESGFDHGLLFIFLWCRVDLCGNLLDCGAEDFAAEEECYEVTTAPDDYYAVRDALEDRGYVFLDSSLGPVPVTYAEVSDPAVVEQLEKMLDMMEDNEDIQEVFNNWDN